MKPPSDGTVGRAAPARRVRLGEVCQEVTVRNRDGANSSVCSVTNSSGFIASTDYFSKEVFSKDLTSYKVVDPSMFAYNPSRINVGSVACWRGNHSVVVSPLYVVFKVDERVVELSVLEKFLHSEIALRQIRSLTSGSVRDSLKFSALCKIELPLPPLPTQRHIAAVLDKICEMKRNAEARLQKLDLLVKARFVEMFGSGGEKVALGDACDVLNGFAFKSERYVPMGIRVIRITNVQQGYVEDADPKFYPEDSLDEIERYMLRADDLLVSLTGNVGRVALLPKEFLPAGLNQRVCCLRIRPDVKLIKSYLFCALNNQTFESRCVESARGVAQKNMSTEWLKLYQIPLPPLSLQREFAAFVARVDALKATVQATLERTDLLYRAKLQEYFG